MRTQALAPGSVLLSPESVTCLVAHLRRCPSPSDLTTRAVVADLLALSCSPAPSRDVLALDAPQVVGSKLTTEQAAQLLGVTPGAVRRRINRGRLPASFQGGRWLIEAKDL